jgi:F0F1-type ATP synthase assembly protein I
MAQQRDKKYKDLMVYAGLATQWFVMLGLAIWGGMALDKKINGGKPIFMIVLPLLALIVSLWRLVKQFNKPKK